MELSSAELKSTESFQSLSVSAAGISRGSERNDSMRSIPEDGSPPAEDPTDPAPPIPQNATPLKSKEQAIHRASALRSTSAINVNITSSLSPSQTKNRTPVKPSITAPPVFEPPLIDPTKEPKVDIAPPSGMYWSRALCSGYTHSALRAHTTTLVGSNIFIFGGCDSKTCFNELHIFDADCMFWSRPTCCGEIPPPLRAMTATAVGKKLVIFGGGDGPTYYNDVYVLDTINCYYTKPTISGPVPSKRRAHTACLYKNGIYVFGGGDGVRALNDVWRLDVSDMSKLSWKQVSSAKASSGKPTARGYHTANMVGSKLIIYGGSDGVDCFDDVWVFDVETLVWKCVDIKESFKRLSHASTVVGSYMFVIGGHDGVEYLNDVLLLNLVTMTWDRRKVYGDIPSGRGYHGIVLYDSRIFSIGGFDGHTVFDETYIMDLGVCSYYSQISHFSIDV